MKGWAMNSSIFCGPFHRATKNLTIHGPPLHIALVMFSARIKSLLARCTRYTDRLIVILKLIHCPKFLHIAKYIYVSRNLFIGGKFR